MILNLILNYVFDKLFVYQFVATLTTYSVLRVVMFIRVRRRRHQLLSYYGIPGPKPRLLDGSMMLYRNTKTTYLVDAELQKKYGKVYCLYIGDEANVVVSDLELLRKIFFEKTSSFKERTVVFMDSPLAQSILFTTHDRWKVMRKVISPTFSTFTMRGQKSTNFIEEVVKLMLDYIEDKMNTQAKNLDDSNKKTASRITLDIHGLMKATALRLITGLAINLPVQVKEDECHVESLDKFLATADSGAVIQAIRFPFLKRVLEFLAEHIEHGKTLSVIRRELNKTIDEGLEELKYVKNGDMNSTSSKRPQLIDTFIKLHHAGKLTRPEVIGNAEAILFAGYDTTSTTLVYIFWVLGKHLEIQEKLRGDLMAHGIESKYLTQVINEVMRLYPTVLTFATRLATENVTIDDLVLPSGAKVVYNSWLMHRNPEIWPEPEKFDPERFREGVQIHPCAFAPFGLSERKCIGFSLAILELKMVTCDLLCRYRISTVAPDELVLHTYATVLTKPSEKIILELERI